MLIVAQMLLLLFVFVTVFFATKPIHKNIRIGIFAYFIITILTFTWLFVNTEK